MIFILYWYIPLFYGFPTPEASKTTASTPRVGSIPASFETYSPQIALRNDQAHAFDPKFSSSPKFFVFQTSGGWGNQRLILRWAMRAANAMNRVLVLPMVAPHTNMWYTNAGLTKESMVPMNHVLDIERIETGLDTKRVIVLSETVESFHARYASKKWLVYTKPQSKTLAGGETKNNWLSENAIRFKFRKRTEDFIFWNKGSMWMCCSGGEEMTKHLAFNAHLVRTVARALRDSDLERYNAAHVRRADGHTRVDRRTPGKFVEAHLGDFDRSLPLYVATDEKKKEWFDPFVTEFGFAKTIFFKESVGARPEIDELTSSFPEAMRGDAAGFVDQIVCCLAEKWAGSDGSTFSFAIAGMRKHRLCEV